MLKKLTVRAAALQAASKGRPIQVVAAYDPAILTAKNSVKELAKLSYREHACSDCGTRMSVSAEVEKPICVTCGGAHVTATKAPVSNTFTRDEELVSVTCGSCRTANVLHADVIKASAYQVHCVTCGEHIKASNDVDDLSDSATKPGSLPAMKGQSQNQTQMSLPPKVSAELEDEVSIDDEDFDDDDDFGDMETSMLGDTDLSHPPSPVDAFDPTFDIDGMPSAEVNNELRVSGPRDVVLPGDATNDIVPDFSGDAVLSLDDNGYFIDETAADYTDKDPDHTSTVGDDFRVEVDAEAEDDLDVEDELADFDGIEGEPIIDTLEMDDTPVALAFVKAGNRLVAMKGHVSIASLSAKAAGKNRDVMFSDTFAHAVTATAQRSGLRSALETFEFSAVKAGKVDKVALGRRVQAMKETAAAGERKRQAERSEILALAAAGLARNYWKGQKNPISAALNAFLQSQGVRRPQPITARIMRDAGMQYAEALLQTATRLEGMSKSVRKELADALNLTEDPGAEYDDPALETEVLSEGDDLSEDYTVDDLDTVVDTSPMSVQSRLSVPATRTRTPQVPALLRTPATAGRVVVSAAAQDVLNGKASLGFSNF